MCGHKHMVQQRPAGLVSRARDRASDIQYADHEPGTRQRAHGTRHCALSRDSEVEHEGGAV